MRAGQRSNEICELTVTVDVDHLVCNVQASPVGSARRSMVRSRAANTK
jgi:hypothetical protein